MAFANQTPIRRNSHILPAAFALLLAGLISVLHLRLFGQSWPLLWLPVAIVALWPSRVGPLLSALAIIIGGLWIDMATLGAPGQWPLALLAVFAVLRPDASEPPHGFVSAFGRVAMASAVAVLAIMATGRFVYGIWPDMAAVGRGIVVLGFATPLVIGGRAALSRWLSGDDF